MRANEAHRHGTRARVVHGQPRGDVGVRRHDDFVAGTDAVSAQYEVQCIEAVADADAMPDLAVPGEFLLEGVDFVAEDEPAGIQHAVEGRLHLGAEFLVRRPHV